MIGISWCFSPDDEKYTWSVMSFDPTNAPSFFTYKIPMLNQEAMMIFRMICNGVAVNFRQSKSKQPNLVVALLPRTYDYVLSCIDLPFPNLEIDDEFTLAPPSSLIMDDIVVLPMEATLNMVRQNMHTSTNELNSGSRVIIDDLLIHSTVFKAYICSC